MRRTGDGELAADLTAETFAAALASRRRFDPAKGPAIGWLYGIARHKLARTLERGRVEDRARRTLGMAPLALDDEAIELVVTTDGDVVSSCDGCRPTSAPRSRRAWSTSRSTSRSPSPRTRLRP